MSERPGTILIVEDDDEMRRLLEEEFQEEGYDVLCAANGAEALEEMARSAVDAVVTDLVMPGMKGDDLLAEIRIREPGLPVVIMTAFGSIDSAVEAMKAGAYHYVAKPFQVGQLLLTAANAVRERRLRQEVADLQRTLGEAGPRIVAESAVMRTALDLLARASAADAAVLLRGESGTGKELFARALHMQGLRRNERFTAVNCSAIPEPLLESHLFGHKRGAFTDAREDRRGLFQETAGGTMFLDEIGDMPPALQSKLLRVLQEGEVHPLGAPTAVPVDVRIVAATHRDLESLIAEGRFRHDLYYRLNVIAIRIPPLRERPEDIVPLTAHILEKLSRRLGRAGCTISSEVLSLFQRYDWPGNVREMENVLERALVLDRDGVIASEDLPEELRRGTVAPVAKSTRALRPLVEMEREHILEAFRAARGNKAAAARLLGLDRKTLYRKLKQFDIRIR